MSELSVQALDATKTDTDRSNYNTEFQTLNAFINDVGAKTFNGKSLFYSEYSLVNSGAITWTAAKAAAEAAGGHLATITSPGEESSILELLFFASSLKRSPGENASESKWWANLAV